MLAYFLSEVLSCQCVLVDKKHREHSKAEVVKI